MALRLALVAELMEWAAGGQTREPTSISVAKLVCVLDFLDTYAKPSALRVFGDAALPASERNAALLARYILRSKVARINARDIRRSSGIPNLKQAQDVDTAAEALVEAGWLRPAPGRSGPTPGRGSKDFLVNPAVHDG